MSEYPKDGRPPHPGKTKAQRRALDAIGCGNFSPIMAKSTRNALLKAELIVPAGERTIGTGWSAIKVAEYTMPIPIHMWWCEAVAFTDEEMAAFEAEMSAQGIEAQSDKTRSGSAEGDAT